MTILSLVITIALILILGGYMLLEAKSKHLPKIPFQLLIIYLGIQLGFDLFGNAAWLGHGKRWIEVAIMVDFIFRSRDHQLAAEPESQVKMQSGGSREDNSQKACCGLIGSA